MNILVELALVFARLGFLAFGGSTAVLPELEHEIVNVRGWLTPKEFVDSFALAALTPGPALRMVMFAGYQVSGMVGAFVAYAALILPSAILATVATAQWNALRRSGWLRSVQQGVSVIALGFTASGAYSISRLALTDAFTIGIALAALCTLWFLRTNAALIVPAGGIAGIGLYSLAHLLQR